MSVKFSEFEKYSGGKGGSKYFSIKDKESATVRFLYNTYDDIDGTVCHNVKIGDRYQLVACPRQEGEAQDVCKYCSEGNQPVLRVPIPIFNEDTKQIEYWMKSGKFVGEDLKMILDVVVEQNKPIASQQYIIKREGNGLDTKYAIIPTGINDGKRKEDFGEVITDAINGLKMIRPANYVPETTTTTPNTQQPAVDVTATRRTTDVF